MELDTIRWKFMVNAQVPLRAVSRRMILHTSHSLHHRSEVKGERSVNKYITEHSQLE